MQENNHAQKKDPLPAVCLLNAMSELDVMTVNITVEINFYAHLFNASLS